MKRFVGQLAAGIALGLLAACGSTDDGGGTGGTGVSTRTGASVGVIVSKDISGVQVNGVRFATGAALVTIAGAPASVDALDIGMVAKVRGRIHGDDTGAAQTIEYAPTVIGAVEEKAAERLIVLGQTVAISEQTVCRDQARVPMQCAYLNEADTIEVSGLADAAGVIHATYIERKTTAATYRVCGRVESLNSSTTTFFINRLQVLYRVADIDDDVALANGNHVIVSGTLSASNVLMASAISGRARFATETDGEEAELEGFVTAVRAVGDFDVDGESVRTDAGTEYRGVTADQVRVGMHLEVEGVLAGNSVNAYRVRLKMER